MTTGFFEPEFRSEFIAAAKLLMATPFKLAPRSAKWLNGLYRSAIDRVDMCRSGHLTWNRMEFLLKITIVPNQFSVENSAE
jgi:hypothetical protein